MANIDYKATNTTSEEVHPTKEGGNGSSGFGGKLKFGFEVTCSGIVHGEFYSKAAGILDEEKPCVNVDSTCAEAETCCIVPFFFLSS